MTFNTKTKINNILMAYRDRIENITSLEKKEIEIHKILNFNSTLFEESIDTEEVKIYILDEYVNQKIEKPVLVNKDYTPWLNEKKPNIDWILYLRYEEYLLKEKKWDYETINSLNKVSDMILDRTRDPQQSSFFSCKGLVMGDIQSGKTTNYTALINKAIDAGYKIVIVLAGLTNDLRLQTQKRLDKEVIGNITKQTNTKGKSIGVGNYTRQTKIVNVLTNSDDKDGDLKKVGSTIHLHKDMDPLLIVIKKNSYILKNLIDFLKSSEENCYTNDKLDVPVLIIDDEVDQASVDTKDANTLETASAINKGIRGMLKIFNRYSYIGYTATPFANIFISNQKDLNNDEQDIFPEDFIIYLPVPKHYSGINDFFSYENDEEDRINDLFVEITDKADLFDQKRINKHTSVYGLNESLKNAIDDFIVASAVKKSRDIKQHNSMLIHLANVKNPSTTLVEYVREYLNEMYQRYKYDRQNTDPYYKNIWIKRFQSISINRNEKFDDNWQNISKYILFVLESAIWNIILVNDDSKDVIDFDCEPKNFIFIGGNKLSRGLTLEGLVVSYYLRKSRTYDAIMQMGRWFGFRKDWLDVCRIYTTIDVFDDFYNVGKALSEFKKEIQTMNEIKETPKEFGLRIAYSPNIAPTAANKMRSAKKVPVSFSGSLQQLISFDKKYIKRNYIAAESFIKQLPNPEINNSKIVFRNIEVNRVLNFLKDYKEVDDLTGSISSKNWIKYIENLIQHEELINWTVVVNSNTKDRGILEKFLDYDIYKPRRTIRSGFKDDSLLKIRALTDPTDFKEFFKLNSAVYNEVKAYNPDLYTDIFTSQHALISIYIFDIHEKNDKTMGHLIEDAKNVIGYGIWFPKTLNFNQSAIYYLNEVANNKTEGEEDEFDHI